MKWNSFLSCKRRIVFALLIPVIAVQFAMSQTSTTGAIRGTVTDAQGAVIVGATKISEECVDGHEIRVEDWQMVQAQISGRSRRRNRRGEFCGIAGK